MKASHPLAGWRYASLALLAFSAGCTTPHAKEQVTQVPGASKAEPSESAASESAPSPAATLEPATLPPATKPATSKPKPKPSALTGWLKTRYRLRANDEGNDHDLYELLAIDYEDPSNPRLAAHFLGRAAVDLDGDGDGFYSSINDTQDGSVDADLYEGYVDLSTKSGDSSARLGRQSDYLTPEHVHFDGLALRSRTKGPRALEFGAYGGRNVTYDSTSNRDEAVLGAFAESRAWKGGRARLDWMHLEDPDLLGDDRNELLGLGLWQNWRTFSASGAYTRLENRDRDLELRTRWADEAGRTSVQLRYFQLLETQTQRAVFLDPYTQALQTYFPFRQWGLSAWRALTGKIDLDLGVDFREVDDSGDVGTFNHDWQRYFATLTLHELIARAWTISLTVDYYDDDQSDVSAVGGDVSREFASDWDLSVGSYYSLYKYDFFSASERDDVRSYFAKIAWKQSATWTFDLRYEFEDDDLEQYHTLRCGALCRF